MRGMANIGDLNLSNGFLTRTVVTKMKPKGVTQERSREGPR